MNAATSFESARPTISMPVRLRGRVFPGDLPDGRRARQTAPELVPEVDDPDIRTQLARDLWKRLEFASLDAEVKHEKDDLIETHNKSLSRIVGFGKDAGRLIRAVCQTNLEFREGNGVQDKAERDAAVGRKLEEMVRKTSPTIMPPKNVLTAEFVTQPSAVIFEKLSQSLHAAVREFADEFFGALEQMVDKRAAGLIEWVGDNLCRYHFFKEVVIQEGVTTETTVGQPWRKPGPWGDEAFQTVTTKRTVENEYRLARHEHHVTHAFHTSIRNSRVVMPLSVQRLIPHIPAWLVDHIHVVDGSLFREIIIEREYDRDKSTDVQTRDEPLPGLGWEPAVVIGSIVLTGCGPREIDAELARRKALPVDHDSGAAHSLGRWNRNGWAALAFSAHVLSAITMVQAFDNRPDLRYRPSSCFWSACGAFSRR